MNRPILRRLWSDLRQVATPMAFSVLSRSVFQLVDVGLVAGSLWLAVAAFGGSVSMGWVVALVVLAVVKAISRYWEQYLGHYVAFGLLAAMRVDFFERVVPLFPGALSGSRRGDLVERVMSDVDRVEVFYAHTVAPVVSGAIVPLAVAAGVGMFAHPVLAGWLLAGVLLAGLVVPAIGWRLSEKPAERVLSAGGELAAHLTDGVGGVGDVVTYGYGERRLAEMEDLASRVAAAENATARVAAWQTAAFEAVAGTAVVMVAWSGLTLIPEGLSPAAVAAAIGAALMGFVPLRDVQDVKPAYEKAMAAAGRIFDIIDRSPLVVDAPSTSDPVPGNVMAFEGVSFTYPDGTTALDDVDVRVVRGRRVGVVGASGSGKSTLARLAVRFYDPDAGSISIDGLEISNMALADLRKRVTVVSQDVHLVDGTVAENILLGAPDAPEGRMISAAALAAADFVEGLDAGYDQAVGEGGALLSGGQRQRIGLARAFVGDAPFLILDEATSDLDTDTEAEVLRSLDRVATDRGILIVAHRLATVVDCDEVVVLDGGRVAERGTHDDLMARGGIYRRLWDRQLDALP